MPNNLELRKFMRTLSCLQVHNCAKHALKVDPISEYSYTAAVCFLMKGLCITTYMYDVILRLIAASCLVFINDRFAFFDVVAVGVFVLECMAETAVWTLNRLANLVRVP